MKNTTKNAPAIKAAGPSEAVKAAVKAAAPAAKAPVEVPRDTALLTMEHQSKLDVAHAAAVETIGQQIVSKTGEIAGLYLSLCLYIRKHQVAPKLVSQTLRKVGFKKQRITEINSVSQASIETFKQWEAKAIGFATVLELSRIEKKDGKEVNAPTGAAQILIESGSLSAEEAESIDNKQHAPKTGGTKQSTTAKVKQLALRLSRIAQKPSTWQAEGSTWKVMIVAADKAHINTTSGPAE